MVNGQLTRVTIRVTGQGQWSFVRGHWVQGHRSGIKATDQGHGHGSRITDQEAQVKGHGSGVRGHRSVVKGHWSEVRSLVSHHMRISHVYDSLCFTIIN